MTVGRHVIDKKEEEVGEAPELKSREKIHKGQ